MRSSTSLPIKLEPMDCLRASLSAPLPRFDPASYAAQVMVTEVRRATATEGAQPGPRSRSSWVVSAACLLVLAPACARSRHVEGVEADDAGDVLASDAQSADASSPLEIEPELDTLSAAAFHNCALRTDRMIECWFLGSPLPRDNHGQVDAPSGRFVDLSASWSHSCALDEAGAVACWGRSATEYHGQADPPPGPFAKVDVGEELSCALDSRGRPTCWGLNRMEPFVPIEGEFVELAVDWRHVCGLDGYGEIKCTDLLDVPAGPFAEVTRGSDHACGRRSTGAVECWGDRDFGQLDVPQDAFAHIDANAHHTCGILLDGTLACWGFDTYGGSTPPSGQFRQLSTGRWHGCGERMTGEIDCWGFSSEESVPADLRVSDGRR
jgi:hypothetical protein